MPHEKGMLSVIFFPNLHNPIQLIIKNWEMFYKIPDWYSGKSVKIMKTRRDQENRQRDPKDRRRTLVEKLIKSYNSLY